MTNDISAAPRSMKASDISEQEFMAVIIAASPKWVSRWRMAEALGGKYPEKVVLAKARKLIKRGLIRGCGCGCRGDFRLPDIVWQRRKAGLGND